MLSIMFRNNIYLKAVLHYNLILMVFHILNLLLMHKNFHKVDELIGTRNSFQLLLYQCQGRNFLELILMLIKTIGY